MADREVTGKKHGAEPWKPGQSGNPKGRPKGSRNQLGEDFLKALHDDFTVHGIKAIQDAREDDAMGYIRVIAGLLPKEMNLTIDPADELKDAELLERIRQLDAAIAFALAGTGETGGQETKGSESVEVRPLRTH